MKVEVRRLVPRSRRKRRTRRSPRREVLENPPLGRTPSLPLRIQPLSYHFTPVIRCLTRDPHGKKRIYRTVGFLVILISVTLSDPTQFSFSPSVNPRMDPTL